MYRRAASSASAWPAVMSASSGSGMQRRWPTGTTTVDTTAARSERLPRDQIDRPPAGAPPPPPPSTSCGQQGEL
jgi:hypothetical protein